MKICPRCQAEHSMNGTYCSRSCANSREQTPEANQKRRDKLKGIAPKRQTPETAKRAREKAQETWKEKRHTADFGTLSWESMRKVVIEQQDGKCNHCGIAEWLGCKLSLEVDHIDGDNQNNCRENLEGLCPNCHSITDTWRGRNTKKNNVSDETLIQALKDNPNTRQALLAVGLSAKGSNYKRANKLLGR